MTYLEHYSLYLDYQRRMMAELRRSIELRAEAGALGDCDGYGACTRWLALIEEADGHYEEYKRLSKLARKHHGIYQSVASRKLARK